MTVKGSIDSSWECHRTAGGSAAQSFNDVKVWLDHDEDGILDAADDVQVADSFDSGTISLSYDNNGNLTDDGLLKYVYDAWNRLVKVNRSADGDTTTIATYAYDGQNRRTKKVVEKCGPEAAAGDGGNTTVRFYYGGVPGASGGVTGWNVFETRNGSNYATRQWVWGTKYVDEVLFMDVNGSPTSDNDCDPDVGGLEAALDRRYFYHQDRNWNVVALTEYEDGPGTAGQIAERYAYTPFGEFVVLTGAGTAERGQVKPCSAVGNPFAHQGLAFDAEKLNYQNRHRDLAMGLDRFMQRDPRGHVDGAVLYLYGMARPSGTNDPTGLEAENPCKDNHQKCTCCMVFGESRGTPGPCQKAVTWVIKNRTEGKDGKPKRPACDVVAEPKQFAAYIGSNYKNCCRGCVPKKDQGELDAAMENCGKPGDDATGGAAWFVNKGTAKPCTKCEKVPDPPGCDKFDFYKYKE